MNTTKERTEQTVSVRTGGDLWRSTTALLDALVDESRFQFSEDGFSVRAVDPANVGMIDLQVPAAAFDAFDASDWTYGIVLDRLTEITDYARKGGNSKENPGDPVIVEFDADRVYARVEPEDKWTRTGSFFHLDPDSVRSEPDLPDLDRPWSGKVDAANLRDAVHSIKQRFDYCGFRAEPEDTGNGSLGDEEAGYLVVSASQRNEDSEISKEDEFRTQEKVLHAAEGEAGVESLFSVDYLVDMTDAIVSAGFDTVRLELGDEFPLSIHFEGSRWGITGEYMLAPRIRDGDQTTGYETPTSPTWGDRFDTTDEADTGGDSRESSPETDEESDTDENDEETDDGATDEDENGEAGEETSGRPECVSKECENTASDEALMDGYPFCGEHDSDGNRDLYDSMDSWGEE